MEKADFDHGISVWMCSNTDVIKHTRKASLWVRTV